MTSFALTNHPSFPGIQGPLLLVIMDGVGLYQGKNEGYPGNAVDLANTPNLDRLFKERLFTTLKAHGTAVGLPSDGDMGNSEVGHNAMGAGRVFDQGAKLVTNALADQSLFDGQAWKEISQVAKEKHTLHFLGLLSDGNVHSHQDHLEAILRRCNEEDLPTVRIHTLLDGRDVGERSAEIYLERLETTLQGYRDKGRDYRIASGGGRMVVTMDRYEADWSMVERGWRTHVAGEGPAFPDAMTALQSLREQYPEKIDQDIPAFVIVDEEKKPVGAIQDGDAVVYFNFRGDRAIEISRAFTEETFDKFERKPNPKVTYAGMMEYDGDLNIPPRYLVAPPAINRTVSEYLARNNIPQYAISETQKFGHVTYFWNGNNSEKFSKDFETWVEIKSDVIPFEQKPEMKALEIKETLLAALREGKHRFYRVNFANGDMVGHTGVLDAAVKAVETVDQCVGELEAAIKELGGTLVLTADHGNSDQMVEVDKKTKQAKLRNGKPIPKTSHTLNPVPLVVTGSGVDAVNLSELKQPGLSNLAATLLFLLGYDKPEGYDPSLLEG